MKRSNAEYVLHLWGHILDGIQTTITFICIAVDPKVQVSTPTSTPYWISCDRRKYHIPHGTGNMEPPESYVTLPSCRDHSHHIILKVQ